MEKLSNQRIFDILIKTFCGFLLQNRGRVLLSVAVLLEVILVYRLNLCTPPPKIPLWMLKPETVGLKSFVDRNGTKHLMPFCESPNLGPIIVDTSSYDLDFLEKKYAEVQGGQYSPPFCNVRHNVAIIVPYKENLQQLMRFLNHMHAFLMKQKSGYGIFIVEQKGINASKYFNRGMLLNVGFMESRKHASGWQCFIFHDIDLLPLDQRNIYSCPHPKHPRHHAAFIHKSDFSAPFVAHFGGVSAFTVQQFTNINGFSNRFWGTGGEDDDMFYRLNQLNYSNARYNLVISRYASFGHDHGSPEAKRNALLNKGDATFRKDGLSNLTYRATKVKYPLYTHIMVDVDLPPGTGYGKDLTNPGSRGRHNAIRFGLSLTLMAFALLIICYTEHRYRRLQQGKEEPNRQIQYCESMSPDLGPISVNSTYIDLEELEDYAFPEVTWGGKFSPRNCTAQDKVAIIVPYRDRQRQLPIFLKNMHRFLMRQKIEYGIYIVEQASRHDYFNRGKLLNVGFEESQKLAGWQCFIFHDIDLLPLDLRNIYSCPLPMHPRHHAASIQHGDQYSKLPYNTTFSGVTAMTLEQFTDVNGFSNTYWGFGGEDDDMVYRMHYMGYTIARYNLTISRYASLGRKRNAHNKNQRYKWYTAMLEARNALPPEGLSTLNYTLHRVVPHRLYTHITAHIGRSPTYHELYKLLEKFKLLRHSSGEEQDQLKEEFIAIL